MSIFGDGPRDRIGGFRRGEDPFDYLDGSARTEAFRVRALVDTLADEYPATHRDALVARLRDPAEHDAASFELILHGMCLRNGMTILEVEPKVPNGKQPDFLVEAPGGLRFYLEATLAKGESDEDKGARKRLDAALVALDDVRSPHFLLDIRHDGTPDRPVGLRRLRHLVQQWLDGIDHEKVLSATRSDAPLPTLRVKEFEGLTLVIRPWPRSRPAPDDGRRATGTVGTMMVREVTPREGMRGPIMNKATRYGDPGLPLVAAVNALEQWAGGDHAIEALFGSEYFYDDGAGPRVGRERDGVWNGPNGPRCRRLSAVLSADRLGFWSLGQRRARLITNPWAVHPADVDFGVDAIRLKDGLFDRVEGKPIAGVFGLPEGWPG